MPSSGAGTETARYIVRATQGSQALAEFIASIQGDAAIRLVDTIGPQGQPHTAVVQTDVATAQLLGQRFRHSNQLIIEPDRPLSLFD